MTNSYKRIIRTRDYLDFLGDLNSTSVYLIYMGPPFISDRNLSVQWAVLGLAPPLRWWRRADGNDRYPHPTVYKEPK